MYVYQKKGGRRGEREKGVEERREGGGGGSERQSGYYFSQLLAKFSAGLFSCAFSAVGFLFVPVLLSAAQRSFPQSMHIIRFYHNIIKVFLSCAF